MSYEISDNTAIVLLIALAMLFIAVLYLMFKLGLGQYTTFGDL